MQVDDLYSVVQIANDVPFNSWSVQSFQDSLSAGNHCLVVEKNTQGNVRMVVAFLVLSEVAGESEILNIAVAVDFKRQGIARQLLSFVIDGYRRVAGDTIEVMFLEVRASNKAAITLYREMGFEHIGVRKRYYLLGNNGREDALVLKRTFID